MAKTFYTTLGYIALILGLGVLPAMTPRLHAQAMPLVIGPGSYVAAGGTASLFQVDYGDRNLGGGAAFVDVEPTWRFGIEAEARFLRYRESEGVSETTYLAGPRIVIRPGLLRPYAKLLAGAGKMDLPFGYAQGTFFTCAPGAGVDYALNDRINLRVVDMEYQLWTKFPYGALRPYGISTGLSFRLTHGFRTATRRRR